MNPRFNEKTILIDSYFEFIDMWLQRNGNEDSWVFWGQARNFYHSAIKTEISSKPLVACYCMLNAAKSLFAVKEVTVSPYHGLPGSPAGAKMMLLNEQIETKVGGVFINENTKA